MFISPVLLQTVAGPYSHSDYIFEPKILIPADLLPGSRTDLAIHPPQ